MQSFYRRGAIMAAALLSLIAIPARSEIVIERDHWDLAVLSNRVEIVTTGDNVKSLWFPDGGDRAIDNAKIAVNVTAMPAGVTRFPVQILARSVGDANVGFGIRNTSVSPTSLLAFTLSSGAGSANQNTQARDNATPQGRDAPHMKDVPNLAGGGEFDPATGDPATDPVVVATTNARLTLKDGVNVLQLDATDARNFSNFDDQGQVFRIVIGPGVAGLTGTVTAPPAPTILRGAVTDSDGQTVPDATVRLIGPETFTVRVDANGEYAVEVKPGDYTALAYTATQSSAPIRNVVVTAAQTKVQNIQLTAETPAVVTLATGDPETNTVWKYLKKNPLPFGEAYINAGPDPAGFVETDSGGEQQSPDDAPGGGSFWLRGAFDLPASFPRDRYAQLFDFVVNARTHGIWINGIPVGSQPTGGDRNLNNFIIPAGVLKATGNVIAILGSDDDPSFGLNGPAPIMIRSGLTNLGAVSIRLNGFPRERGGVADAVSVTLKTADGAIVATQTTRATGAASFLHLPSGDYTVEATGAIVAPGQFPKTLTVNNGEAATVEGNVHPAISLATPFLGDQQTWLALADADPANLDPIQLSFQPGAEWTPVIAPLNLKNSGQWSPVGTFGDNQDLWYRLKFTVPAEWQALGGDLYFDQFNVDDTDVTYFNGTKIGETSGAGTVRDYKVAKDLVRFGQENVIAILAHNGTGDSGITQQERTVRLRVAPGEVVSLCRGDATGDKALNVEDAIAILQHVVNIKLLTGDALTATRQANAAGDADLDVQDAVKVLRVAVDLDTDIPKACP